MLNQIKGSKDIKSNKIVAGLVQQIKQRNN